MSAKEPKRAGSRKSGTSNRSRKSDKPLEQETDELEMQPEKLQEKIDNNLAYVAEGYEKGTKRVRDRVYHRRTDCRQSHKGGSTEVSRVTAGRNHGYGQVKYSSGTGRS